MLGISAGELTVKSSKAGMYVGKDFPSLKYASSWLHEAVNFPKLYASSI